MIIPDSRIVISGLLIAAGASTRLGQPKQLIKYKNKYLINYVVDELLNSEINELSIVLGSESKLIQSKINTDLHILINENWKVGMGGSIVVGVNNLNNKCDGVLISLVDQYLINSNLINSLIDQFNSNSNDLIVSKYGNGRYGPPAIFPKRLIEKLKLLSGDRGAAAVVQAELKNNIDQVIVVGFENGHLDIDTPEDLLKIQK